MTQDTEPSSDLQEFNTLMARYKAQSWADVPRTFAVGLALLGLALFCTFLTLTLKTSFFMVFILPTLATLMALSRCGTIGALLYVEPLTAGKGLAQLDPRIQPLAQSCAARLHEHNQQFQS